MVILVFMVIGGRETCNGVALGNLLDSVHLLGILIGSRETCNGVALGSLLDSVHLLGALSIIFSIKFLGILKRIEVYQPRRAKGCCRGLARFSPVPE